MSKKQTQHPNGLETRFAIVRGYLLDRGARNYMSVFAAHGETFNAKETARLYDLWNARKRVVAADLPLIQRMERVIEHLKAA